MVWVFKTNVTEPQQVQRLRPVLDEVAGCGQWNFALDDTDRILRVVGECVGHVVPDMLARQGFDCKELTD